MKNLNHDQWNAFFSHIILAFIAAFSSVSVDYAKANIGDHYGFGSKSAGLAGAGTAFTANPYSAYENPAQIGRIGFDDQTERTSAVGETETKEILGERIQLSLGSLFMRPRFTPISEIVVENEYVSDKVRTGSANTDYRDTLGTTFGANFLVSKKLWNLGVGTSVFMPASYLAHIDTGDAYAPDYFMYRARTQRPQIHFGFGLSPVRHFSLGIGMYFGYSLTSNASVFLQTDPNKPSSLRFSTTMKPRAAPVFGFFADPEIISNIPTKFGLTIRTALESPNEMVLQSGARAFGSLAALDFHFSALSTLFYDPLTIEPGLSFDVGPLRTHLQFNYEFWSKFKAPTLEIQDPETDNVSGVTGIQITPGSNPTITTHDIFIPKIAEELILESVTLRAGVSYRPSALTAPSTEAGNFIDPPQMIYNIGSELPIDRWFELETPIHVNLHFAYHKLTTQNISKSTGDELGAGTGNLKIGAPGYQAGGHIFGGGMSLDIAL